MVSRHIRCPDSLRTFCNARVETLRNNHMPKGDKSSYTSKQKRKASHIEESYEKRGVSKKTAKARAWATVNKSSGGGKKRGSGRGKKTNKAPAKKGGRKGGAARKRKTA